MRHQRGLGTLRLASCLCSEEDGGGRAPFSLQETKRCERLRCLGGASPPMHPSSADALIC